MPTIREIDVFMSETAPKNLSEPWDNDGIMLCENPDKNAEKIITCLEINDRVIDDALSFGADLIITHHPFIFHPLKNLCDNVYKTIYTLMNSGISVLSYHTRMDAACGGVNDTLCEKLSLLNITEFFTENVPMGRVGKLPSAMSPEQFAKHLKKTLGVGAMRCAVPDKNKKISTVAVVGGGGKDFVKTAASLADAYVSSDFSHNTFIDAKELGICIFDAGHYYTENPIADKMREMLVKKYPEVSVYVSDSRCPYEIL